MIVSRKTFTSGESKFGTKWRLRYLPASQSNILFSGGYIFNAREHLSNQARQIARDCDFQRPKREYPERPRPVSSVYFYQSTGSTVLGVRELCYATSCC